MVRESRKKKNKLPVAAACLPPWRAAEGCFREWVQLRMETSARVKGWEEHTLHHPLYMCSAPLKRTASSKVSQLLWKLGLYNGTLISKGLGANNTKAFSFSLQILWQLLRAADVLAAVSANRSFPDPGAFRTGLLQRAWSPYRFHQSGSFKLIQNTAALLQSS